MSARRNFKFAVEELKNYSVKIFSKKVGISLGGLGQGELKEVIQIEN